MSEKIEAALTPEEWAALPTIDTGAFDIAPSSPDGTLLRYKDDPEVELAVEYDNSWRVLNDRHRIAALALLGQPYGFTWEMVDAILTLSTPWAGDFFEGFTPEERSRAMNEMCGKAQEAADRIAALLPPRD